MASEIEAAIAKVRDGAAQVAAHRMSLSTEAAMHALTLTQPWATAIALGLKRIETRSWSTNYRGPLVIHAAKGYPRYAREFATELRQRFPGFPQPLPVGAIVCAARLVAVRRTEDLWNGLSPQEEMFGDYGDRRFGWVLEDIRALAVPVVCKGALGLWVVPPGVAMHVNTQLRGV